MKIKIPALAIAIISLSLLSSCSPKIVGTWNVDKYETSVGGKSDLSLSNIGTITFRRNGNGEKSLNYKVLGVQRDDNIPFKWNWDNETFITIDSEGSEFSKTWIIIENKKKVQRWKSTDGSNLVQELTLVK